MPAPVRVPRRPQAGLTPRAPRCGARCGGDNDACPVAWSCSSPGQGTNLQALLDACADESYGAQVVAVGADRDGCTALERAAQPRHPHVHAPGQGFSRTDGWDAHSRAMRAYGPDLVVPAGFMKLVGPAFLASFGGRLHQQPSRAATVVSRHARRAGRAGVRSEGVRLHDLPRRCGVDDGPVIAQAARAGRDDDDEASLHERIKVTERALLVQTVGRMVREGWSVHGRKVRIGR